jgi:hypothetical protein
MSKQPDLTPGQCRDEAGPKFILSGGVPPDSFSPNMPLKVLDEQIEAWLALRHDATGRGGKQGGILTEAVRRPHWGSRRASTPVWPQRGTRVAKQPPF